MLIIGSKFYYQNLIQITYLLDILRQTITILIVIFFMSIDLHLFISIYFNVNDYN